MKHKWERFQEMLDDKVVFGDGQFFLSQSSKISLDDALYLR
jgi:hypothetical protein